MGTDLPLLEVGCIPFLPTYHSLGKDNRPTTHNNIHRLTPLQAVDGKEDVGDQQGTHDDAPKVLVGLEVLSLNIS